MKIHGENSMRIFGFRKLNFVGGERGSRIVCPESTENSICQPTFVVYLAQPNSLEASVSEITLHSRALTFNAFIRIALKRLQAFSHHNQRENRAI